MPPPPAHPSSSAAQEGDWDLLRRLWPHHVHQGPRNRLCRKGISFPSLFSLFTFHSPSIHHLVSCTDTCVIGAVQRAHPRLRGRRRRFSRCSPTPCSPSSTRRSCSCRTWTRCSTRRSRASRATASRCVRGRRRSKSPRRCAASSFPRPPLPAPSARKQPRTLHAHSPHTLLTRTGTLRPQTLEDAKFVYDEENEKWTRDAETIERGSRVRVKVTSVNQQAQSIVSVPPLPPPPLTASPTAVRAGDRPEVRLSVCRVCRCCCCCRRCSICVQIPPNYHFVRHRFAERLRCRRARQTFFDCTRTPHRWHGDEHGRHGTTGDACVHPHALTRAPMPSPARLIARGAAGRRSKQKRRLSRECSARCRTGSVSALARHSPSAVRLPRAVRGARQIRIAARKRR